MSIADLEYRKLMESIQSVNERVEDALHLPKKIIPFTQKTRYLKGKPFSFKQRPYLHDIYHDDSPELYITKGRQTELSEFLINKIIYNGYKYPRTVGLYLSDRDDHTSVFSNYRIEQLAIKDSPIIQKFIPLKSKTATKMPFNNGSIVYFFSAWNSYAAARSIPADFVYLDEIQGTDVGSIDVIREGLAHNDMYNTIPKQLIGVGTGDYEDTAWHKQWHKGTQNKWDYKTKKWIPKYPDRRIASYHVSQVIVPWITNADIERKYNDSPNKNKFTMEVLGWWVKGIKKPITESAIRKLFNPSLSFVRPNNVDHSLGPVLCGIDLGGGKKSHTIPWITQVIDLEIPIHRLLYTVSIDDSDVEVQADKLIRLVSAYSPDQSVIDIGGGTRQLQKLENRLAHDMVKCLYRVDLEKPYNYDKLYSHNMIKVDRTHTIDVVIDMINNPYVHPKTGKTIPRYQIPFAEPKKIKWIIPHFTSIISKMAKMASGQEYIKYDKEPEDVHDALMAANYNAIAFEIWKRNNINTAYGTVGTLGT